MEPQTGPQPTPPSIPPATFYGVSKKHHSTGKVLAIVLLVLIIMGCVAFGVYYWQQQKLDDANSKNQQLTAQVQSLQTTVNQTTKITLTPTANKSTLQVSAPSGWVKTPILENIMQRNINGVLYRVLTQSSTSDALKLPIYQASSVAAAVKDAKGTTLYLLNVGNTLTVSTCAPTKAGGCSPVVGGMPTQITLSSYQQGDQSVRPLDFTLPSATQAVSDFQAMLASLTV